MHFRSFQTKLFIRIAGIFLLFVLLITAYQYRREREFKTDLLHARLQMYNLKLMRTLGDSLSSSTAFANYVNQNDLEGLRVTIMTLQGRVVQDNSYANVKALPNHADRQEVKEALLKGDGYVIKRRSESTDETYFYSATQAGNYIVRSAVPYDAMLVESLQPKYTFLWYSLMLTILLIVVLYRSTTRISRHIRYLREFAVKAKSGEELDHELERKLPDDELGDISHTIITLFWKLRHSESDKERLKRQLTQNAAHELKTPAASINGYLESIISNPDMPEATRAHFMERCYAQSQRMCKLLQDMSTLTRMDDLPYSNIEDNLSTLPPVSVPEMLHTMIEDAGHNLEAKGIVVEMNVDENVELRCDKSALQSIFQNLFDNAMSYADGATCIKFYGRKLTGGETPTGETKGCKYEFSVVDDGCGVDPKHLLHIFERFYRVDKGRSRQMGGTGLGLSIVKNLVLTYGGSIKAENTPGGGLTISFTLIG